MAMLSSKAAYPAASQYATYRLASGRENHGFFASPTESEFSEHNDMYGSVRNWDEERVAEWLRSINCSQYIELFTSNNINGAILMELDRNHLRDMGIKKVGDQIRISSQAKNFRNKEYKSASKASKNRDSLAILDNAQFQVPSSASPKSGQNSRFVTQMPRNEKRLSRQINDYNHSNYSVAKPSSRPSSPYVEQDRGPPRTTTARYGGMSPQREHYPQSAGIPVRTPASSSSDSVLISRYGTTPAPRSATVPVETPKTARFAHSRASPSIDSSVSTSSILPQDKALIRVIFDTGRTSVVNIDGCKTVEDIMLKTLRKGSLNEIHVKNYCFYVLDGIDPNPALCRRINEAEVIRICSDRTRLERNRLILRKLHMGEPEEEQLKTAASIAQQIQIQQQQQQQQQSNIIIPTDPYSKMKIEKVTGEALAPVSYPQSPASAKERERHIYATQQDLQRAEASRSAARAHIRRIKEHFGGRPPSELIASDLSTYFPDFEKDQIDRTLRMSIRRSRRISRATNRLSTISNVSFASSLKDAPPLPSISDTWLRGDSQSSKGLRPLSVLRLGSGSGYRDSVTSSVLEPLDEESPLDSDNKSYVSFGGVSDTIVGDSEATAVMQSYYDDGRSSIANSSMSGEGNDSLNKRLSQLVHDDSEESDEELTEYLETGSWDNIKYMKGALIGQGSFGSVYLALHAVTAELMAVKQVELPGTTGTVLDAKKNTMLDALKHEIGLLRELKHPNIVRYLGSNSDDTHLNILLEYVPGGSVATMLVNYGPLGETMISNFVRQILTGLAYLHSKDIIHRDIKGANILVDNKGSVKISDFGISKRVQASSLLTSGAKKAGQRVSLQGSVFWMAPEVVKQTAYTPKADIWSLGCLVIEMFTGQHPHPNCSQLQAIFKIGASDGASTPTIPDNASKELRHFCKKTFEIEHERRPEAEELLKTDFVISVGGDSNANGSSSSNNNNNNTNNNNNNNK